ncbi:ATP-binding cassette sub- A member 5 [Entophlyctis sp. JEL0112]|nr:ATP-binding cassette sub- A member 5 [Entophlyctis sp. JEL0112]
MEGSVPAPPPPVFGAAAVASARQFVMHARRMLLSSQTVVLLWRSAKLKRRQPVRAFSVALAPLVNPLILMSVLAAIPYSRVEAFILSSGAGLIPDQIAILSRIAMSAYLVLGFSAHSQSALIEMVVEKERKIKEGLLMQGLSPLAFWFSVHLTHTVYAAIVSSNILKGFSRLTDTHEVFLLLFFLDLANISSTLTFAPFFNTSKAALLFDSFFSIVLFTIPIILIFWFDWGPSELAIIFISVIFYPLGFFFGMLRLNQLEMEGEGANWQNSLDGRGIGGFLIVLGIDCILYMAIALYLDQVIPQEHSTPRPWWFPVKYISKTKYDTLVRDSRERQAETARRSSTENLFPESPRYIEPDPPGMIAMVSLRDVRVKFPNASMNAVDGVNLDLFSDEIFALLGHNGAGKSTTLHILTGLIPATTGYGTVAGLDLANEMEAIRRNIGVCPQHDIQHDDLTVYEHVMLFAGIKGLWGTTNSKEELELIIDKVLSRLGLEEKRDAYAKTLSGGQKRKLSIAMAIIGDPKILVLDEPTAGMDPVSRRAVWKMLSESKKGRLTFLTTHMMDEADFVADRKAILSKGRIRCVGTSIFLKHRFNIGYQLNIAHLREISSDLKISSLVAKYIPTATSTSTYDVNPRSHAVRATGENIMTFSIPQSGSTNFPRLFSTLDREATAGNILFYGLSMPTLEEVFLKSEGGGSSEVPDEARLAEEYWTRLSANDAADEETMLLGNENVLRTVPIASQIISIVHARWLIFGRSLSSSIPSILFPLYMFYPIFTEDISSATSSFWLISMSLFFTAASWSRETVQERSLKINSFLKSMGVSSLVYWLSLLLAQTPLMATPGLIMCWLVELKHVPAYGGAGFWMFLISNIEFAVLALVSSYLFGFAFKEPGSFLTTSSLLITFGAALPYSCLVYFDTMGDPDIGAIVHAVMSFTVPTYPFSAILYLMAVAHAKSEIGQLPPLTPGYYFEFGHGMIICLLGMAVQILAYGAMVIWLDGGLEQVPDTELTPEEIATEVDCDGPEDPNVVTERGRVVRPLCTDEVILRRLRKIYERDINFVEKGWNLVNNTSRSEIGSVSEESDKNLVAVRDVSVGCSKGEVLAILGPNGAGKTTTVLMALGEIRPTRGAVAISSLDTQTAPQNVLARASLFGQVAQHDTLWPLLTAREHLNLYASLKGIVQRRRTLWIRLLVDAMGSNLGLELDKRCSELSGGTKRKIAFLMALVGKPKILFLDEPTTGIDPKAKRNLWNLVKALRKRLTTILTTHSLEEADNLASRIGIMIGGNLAVLGTQQYIKSTYGQGFLLEARMSGRQDSGSLENLVKMNLPNAVLTEKFENVLARWEVPANDVENLGGMGKVFELLEHVKATGRSGLEEFCFGQVSLESVFLRFVQRDAT